MVLLRCGRRSRGSTDGDPASREPVSPCHGSPIGFVSGTVWRPNRPRSARCRRSAIGRYYPDSQRVRAASIRIAVVGPARQNDWKRPARPCQSGSFARSEEQTAQGVGENRTVGLLHDGSNAGVEPFGDRPGRSREDRSPRAVASATAIPNPSCRAVAMKRSARVPVGLDVVDRAGSRTRPASPVTSIISSKRFRKRRRSPRVPDDGEGPRQVRKARQGAQEKIRDPCGARAPRRRGESGFWAPEPRARAKGRAPVQPP